MAFGKNAGVEGATLSSAVNLKETTVSQMPPQAARTIQKEWLDPTCGFAGDSARKLKPGWGIPSPATAYSTVGAIGPGPILPAQKKFTRHGSRWERTEEMALAGDTS